MELEHDQFPHNNLLKPEFFDEFGFESSSSNNFFQDLHSLNNQFSQNGNSSSTMLNPGLGLGNVQDDGFDPFPDGYLPNLDDIYDDFKPFSDMRMNNGGGTINNVNSAFQNFHGGFFNNNLPKKAMVDQTSLICNSQTGLTNFMIPDEGSCVTVGNVNSKAGNRRRRSGVSDAFGFPTDSKRPQRRGHKKSNAVKGQWTMEEDRLLIHLVEKFGVRKWSHIAQCLHGRIGKQCRERWYNHLRPDIKKDTWTEEEDKILIRAHSLVGNKWAEIAKALPGRTENSIKNHWNATKRSQYSTRKIRTKYPRTNSLLQNYIKSLNLDGKPDGFRNVSPMAAFKLNAMFKPPLVRPPVPFTNSDRVVPDFDLDNILDFPFDEDMFEETNLDFLLEDTMFTPMEEERSSDGGYTGGGHCMQSEVEGAFVQSEVKKELDLIEMIQQVNHTHAS